jgi:NAD(P)-dependent dehydrogenase (short-subunit alcohol dehydrogenase family)
MNLNGKVAVVSGGAVRLGRALTLALAASGCHVFIHYGRSEEAARRTQADAIRHGVDAAVYAADLTEVAETQGIIGAAVAHFGRVDILINNAAIFLPGGLSETSVATWESQFAVNLRAPFLLSQGFAAQLAPGGRGKIINVGDARIFRPAAEHLAYRLTKAALLTLTQSLAQALAPRITVNAVALGAILPPADKDPAYLEELAHSQIPLRRPGKPDHAAASVLHLLQQDFLTGVILPVDGGQFL